MNHSARSVVLIGFMGTGKSSVGRVLSQRLEWPLFDVDLLIEEKLKMPIAQIFARLGEEYFREQESAVLLALRPARPSIVVSGGGAVLRSSNVARLRSLGTVVCLTTGLNDLRKRLCSQTDRPLLQTDDPSRAIELLFEERAALYREAADLTIDTSSVNPEQVADSILDALALAT